MCEFKQFVNAGMIIVFCHPVCSSTLISHTQGSFSLTKIVCRDSHPLWPRLSVKVEFLRPAICQSSRQHLLQAAYGYFCPAVLQDWWAYWGHFDGACNSQIHTKWTTRMIDTHFNAEILSDWQSQIAVSLIADFLIKPDWRLNGYTTDQTLFLVLRELSSKRRFL